MPNEPTATNTEPSARPAAADAAAPSCPPSPPSPQPFGEQDLLRFTFVGDPALSPDGRRVAYVRTVMDPERNRYLSRLMVQELGASPDRSGRSGQGEVSTDAAGGPATPPTAPVGEPIAWTHGPGADFAPAWSPNGRYLAFLSDREADQEAPPPRTGGPGGGRVTPATRTDAHPEARKLGPQIYLMRADGGEARRLTDLLGGIESFQWSPDSSRLAFVARIRKDGPRYLHEAEPPGEPQPQPQAWARWDAQFNQDVREISRRFYRLDGVGWFEDKRAQVFVLDVEAAWSAAQHEGVGAIAPPLPQPVQITAGPYDHKECDWSPDGRWLAVSACRTGDPDYQRFTDIWLFHSDGQGEPVKVTASTGPAECPRFSPDGRALAYLGHERQQGGYTNRQVWRVDLAADGLPPAGAAPRSLTRPFDRSFGDWSAVDMRRSGPGALLTWSADGRGLYCLASDQGTTQLYRIDASNGQVQPVTAGDQVLFTFDLRDLSTATNPGEIILVAGIGTPTDPGELYLARLPAVPAQAQVSTQAEQPPPQTQAQALPPLQLEQWQPLTQVNRSLLDQHLVVTPEHFAVPIAGDGTPPSSIDAWALPPVRRQPGQRYPAVLAIHGGPQMMYTSQFFFEFQVLAGAGIGVIFCNPRGGAGYGEAFCADIRGDWGNHDYADVMAAVDQALARFDWIDPDRLGVAGGSYGGFLTSWIIGHTSRFRAAVSMRAVNNLASQFGTSDSGALWDEVFGGTPWDNPDSYRRQSPITYAGEITTPTLILHSEQDFRCPVEQGEQLYAALKTRGVEAKMVRYPDESHGLSRGGKPWHRVDRLRQIRRWFAAHLDPQDGPKGNS